MSEGLTYYEHDAAVTLLAHSAFAERAELIGVREPLAAQACLAVRRGIDAAASAPASMYGRLEDELGPVPALRLVEHMALLLRHAYWEWYIPLVEIAQSSEVRPGQAADSDMISRIKAIASRVPLTEAEEAAVFGIRDDADRAVTGWFEFGLEPVFLSALREYRIRRALRAVLDELPAGDLGLFQDLVNGAAKRRRPRWPAAFVVPADL